MKNGIPFSVLFPCFLIYALLRYPAPLLAASAESIQLWLTTVFPSLFPFLTTCGILVYTGTAERTGRLLRPFMKPVFGLDGIAAFPFFLGLLSGYPAGAKLTAQLYKNNRITAEDAQHILVFSNNPGPLFLIGTIGSGFLNMPHCGYLLLLSSALGAIATGILWRFRPKKQFAPKNTCSLPTLPYTLSEAFSVSVSDAVNTILLIGGYLIFFSVVSEALKQAGIFRLLCKVLFFLPLSAEAIQGVCSGILEMTGGSFFLSCAPDSMPLKLTCISFLVSFGGLSILGQTFGILSAVPISKKDYLKGKLCNALFSSLFCYCFLLFSEQKAQKAVPALSLFTETAFPLSFLWLITTLLCLGALLHSIMGRY